MNSGPDDPVTLMKEGAIQMHELFTSYVEAGFNRKEALALVIAVMNASIASNKPESTS